MSVVNQIKLAAQFKAAPANVYYAITNHTGWREWFCDIAETETKEFNRLYFWWNSGYYTSGRFTDLEDNQSVNFTWRGHDEPGETKVSIRLQEQDQDTLLSLEHSGFGETKKWQSTQDHLRELWGAGLENLQAVLETGWDSRKYNKPMVGVYLGPIVSPELAEEKDLPAAHGLLLEGVLKGLGAEAAGLRKGDQVIEIDGIRLEDHAAITKAMHAHVAGDEIELVYYRENEIYRAEIKLAPATKPDVPTTAQGLSEAAVEIYESIDAKIMESFEEMTDEEAEFKPAPGEWNVKEILAHLIISERDAQTWIGSLVFGNETAPYTAQLPARLKSLLSIYPQVEALRAELRRAWRESEALLAELPIEFVERKGSYYRLAGVFLEEIVYHYKDHMSQINDNLTKARQNA